jgi:hypothetical protein
MKDLDREIDLAVRSMLDEEPSAAFRTRVMAALQPDERRRGWMSWGLPFASAAVVMLVAAVVFMSSHRGAPAGVDPGRGAQPPSSTLQLAERLSAPVVAPPTEPTIPARRGVQRAASAPQGPSSVHAMSLEEPVETGIDALAAPAPRSVGTLTAPVSTTIPSIQPEPLRVNALDLPALEMPRDAARGEDR